MQIDYNEFMITVSLENECNRTTYIIITLPFISIYSLAERKNRNICLIQLMNAQNLKKRRKKEKKSSIMNG